MQFIRDSIHDNIMEALSNQYSQFNDKFQNLQFAYNVALTEAVDNSDLDPDLDMAFAQLLKRLEAAKRGLGLSNKLPNNESRVMHRRAIMSNMNKIRTLFNFIGKKLGDSDVDSGNPRQDYSYKAQMQNQQTQPQNQQTQPQNRQPQQSQV